MTSVVVEFHLEAAHSLPHLPATHKCSRVHGHRYVVELTIGGPIDPEMGWIIDYAWIEKAWTAFVFDKLDHRNLNEALETDHTTSEYIAEWIADTMNGVLPRDICVQEVFVRETARFGARWRRN